MTCRKRLLSDEVLQAMFGKNHQQNFIATVKRDDDNIMLWVSL